MLKIVGGFSGSAQYDGRYPCAMDAKLLWQYAKIFITMATGVCWRSLNDAIKFTDSENPTLVPESSICLL